MNLFHCNAYEEPFQFEGPGAILENWPKGGHNSSQRYTSTRLADHFSQFLLTMRSETYSKNFTCCIFYKNSLNFLLWIGLKT